MEAIVRNQHVVDDVARALGGGVEAGHLVEHPADLIGLLDPQHDRVDSGGRGDPVPNHPPQQVVVVHMDRPVLVGLLSRLPLPVVLVGDHPAGRVRHVRQQRIGANVGSGRTHALRIADDLGPHDTVKGGHRLHIPTGPDTVFMVRF